MSSSLRHEEIFQIVSTYATILGYITFSSGIIGNAINIYVFTYFKFLRNNRCIFYLIIESISDFLYQIFSISLTILISIYRNDLLENSLMWCRLKHFLSQLFGLVTLSKIYFASIDQYFSTSYRFNLRQLCTFKLARYLTFTTICIWLIHSIGYSFFINIVPSIGCIISNKIWIRYSTFFFYPVLAGLLPIVIASTFSLLAFRNVHHIILLQIPIKRRRLNHQIIAMVLFCVVCFVSFTLLYIVHRIYVVDVPITQANPFRYAIEQLVQTVIVSIVNLNYTVNFYIFMIASSRYRRQVKYVLVKKCWQQWINWCCFRGNQIRPENTSSINSNIELE